MILKNLKSLPGELKIRLVKKLSFNQLIQFCFSQRNKKNLIENLSQQYLSRLNRFQTVQRTGATREKESLDRARSVTYHKPSIHSSPDEGDSLFSNYQNQQQVVLPMERHVDLQGLQERDDQLQQIEVYD